VLAHTPKRAHSRPITVNDLQGSKVLSNFADNIFAIGQSKLDPAVRYLKQIKPRSTEMIYDASNVLCFRIAKFDGRFLGFEHYGNSAETVHLADAAGGREWDLIETIKRMSDEGLSVRQIALELKISKTHVHRLLKRWVPEMGIDDEEFEDDDREHEPAHRPDDFPGSEEYTAALNDPRYDGIYSREDAEAYELRRETYLLDLARSRARQKFLETGDTPRLAEMLAEVRAGSNSDSLVRTGSDSDRGSAVDTAGVAVVDSGSGSDLDISSAVAVSPGTPRRRTIYDLEKRTDAYGKDFFVEETCPTTGKAKIYYTVDRQGIVRRWVRGAYGSSATHIGPAPYIDPDLPEKDES
jgi:hypothetical protein